MKIFFIKSKNIKHLIAVLANDINHCNHNLQLAKSDPTKYHQDTIFYYSYRAAMSLDILKLLN